MLYIGSDNMYPVNMQIGYIVDDAKAAQKLTDAHWTAAVAVVLEGGRVGIGRRELYFP